MRREKMRESNEFQQLFSSSLSSSSSSSPSSSWRWWRSSSCVSISLSLGIVVSLLIMVFQIPSGSDPSPFMSSSSSAMRNPWTAQSSSSFSSASLTAANTSSSPTWDSKTNYSTVDVIKHKESISYNSSKNASQFQDLGPMNNVVRKEYSKLERVEVGLARARDRIRKAARNGTLLYDGDYIPQGPIYRNARAFHRSYLEMEKSFKVYVYEEGEPPLFHTANCKSIYAIEGIFINDLEISKFRTRNPDEAHVFFLPFSVVMMVQYIFVLNSHDSSPFDRTINDYINVIAEKHPYWNRSHGADHFMVSCHDWAPDESAFNSFLYNNSIRVLCNANTSEGFNPSKDAALPEIHLPSGKMPPPLPTPSPSRRTILAFFAGGLHGPIRPILLNHWKDKGDQDMQVFEYLPKHNNHSYIDFMRNSKYCLCPSGYEVASPRVVEALYNGCVPVLISEGYIPPFSDVLNWDSFAVVVSPSEIPKLKEILMGIPVRKYIRMQRRGVQARRHFEVNMPPKRFDVFHMILHSVWLRRLNVRIHA